jgi:signal peptidase I
VVSPHQDQNDLKQQKDLPAMTTGVAQREKKKGWGISGLWMSAFVLVAAFVGGRLFLYPADVQGSSMNPHIQEGERLLVHPLNHPHRGDIVIVREAARDHHYVKRVIATAGEHLRIDKGYVFINDRPIDEPYIGAGLRSADSYAEITVPADSCFVLSDNRWIQEDSREFGVIKYSWIEGKVWGVYWPFHNSRLM